MMMMVNAILLLSLVRWHACEQQQVAILMAFIWLILAVIEYYCVCAPNQNKKKNL